MIHLILLAAGLSRRFGGNKLLCPLAGKCLYEHALDCAISFQQNSAEPTGLILVTAYDEIEAGAEKRGFLSIERAKDFPRRYRRTAVRNNRQTDGISHSIFLGLSAAKPDKDDFLMFSVCDQPYLDSEELLCFFDSFARSGKGIGCMAFGDNRGNPVLFRASYQEELLLLRGDEGGRKVIREHGEDLYLYQTASHKRLKDIDEKSDLPTIL